MGKKILIVDDEEETQALLEFLLRPEGHILYKAGDGEEGLSLAIREQPDLIILDVILPSISGWEVCEKLKENQKTRDIPIIFVTIKDMPRDASRFTSMIAGYFTKPFKKAELKKRIKELLDQEK